MKKKPTHGGKRKGAGRPTGSGTKERTHVMRIPDSQLETVERIINLHKSRANFQVIISVKA